MNWAAPIKFCVLAFAATSFSSISAETEVISLDEMLQRAESNEILQRDIRGVLESARLRKLQVQMEKWLTEFDLTVLGGVIPDVNADDFVANRNSTGFLFDTDSNDLEGGGFSTSQLGPFSRIELKAVQPIWTWGKIGGYEQMAEINMGIAEFEKRKLIDEVRFLTKKAYYTVQFTSDALSVLDEVKEKLNAAEKKVEELLIKNAENVEENDRLKIKVFLADVENRSLDALRGLRVARSSLQELAGVSGDWQPDQANLEAELIQDLEREAIVSQALRTEPQLQRLTRFVKVKEAEKMTIRADLFPSFFVGGELNYAVAPGRTDVSNPYLNDPFNTFNFGVVLGLKQDLGIHRSLNKLSQINAEISRLTAQRDRLSSFVRLKADEAFQKAAAAQQGIQINERGFRAARSWLTSTGLAFNLGTAPTKDVLESYAAYFKARVDLLKSVYDLNLALGELSKTAGVEVVGRLKKQD